MLIITSNNNNPYFNIALEDYLFSNFTDNIFLLYKNTESVIIGKHQNAYAEINFQYITENKIDIARRISGGGTVFHDLGNINFTFIINDSNPNNLSFERVLTPIINTINKLNANALINNRNDITINNYKISGNAKHIKNNRLIQHGTILFDANIEKLKKSLNNNYSKYCDKSVKSVKSKVDNLSNYIDSEIGILEFEELIINEIKKTYTCSQYFLTSYDIKTVNDLAYGKYKTWEWIFGYSPEYRFTNKLNINKLKADINITVKNGIIINDKTFILHNNNIINISEKLISTGHRIDSIIKILETSSLNHLINNEELKSLANSFFY